jgi:hypothetical protein
MATTISGQLAVRIQERHRQSVAGFQENLVRFRVKERRRPSRFNERGSHKKNHHERPVVERRIGEKYYHEQ